MADYFASLRKLLPRDETLYIPTHGAEIRNPNPFVQSYIEHRLGREAQVLARLEEGPQTIAQMVAKNYADTPLHLHKAAGRSMLAHLVQLAKDGRVKTEDGRATADSIYRL
jgi:ankyrin repeat protein